ncbi:conserved hypothetical protein, partial [Ricinus communis]
ASTPASASACKSTCMPASRSSTSCSRPPSTPPPASTPMPSSALNSEHRLLPEPTAPDLFAHAFRWHEKFLPPAGTSLMQHCATAPDAPLAQMLHALGALLRQGLVQPVQHSGLNGHGYLQPDFSAPPVRLQASEQIDIVMLTAALDGTSACHWAAAVAGAVATQAPAPAPTPLTI